MLQMEIHQADDANRRWSRVLSIVVWEWRIVMRAAGVRLALALLGLLMVIALLLGAVRTRERQKAAALAEKENSWAKAIVGGAIQGNSSEAAPASEDFVGEARKEKQLRQIAKSPYLLSHASELWTISLWPSPLSCLSVGASESWPDRYRLIGVSRSQTLERDERIRPLASVHGPFDATFVIVAIAPLIVIGLTFNAASSDRERGLQNLIEMQASSIETLLLLRCLVRASAIILVTESVTLAVVLPAFGDQFNFQAYFNLAIWGVAVALYLLVWVSLSFLVNSMGTTSTANGAMLLLMWVVLVLLVPSFVSYAVQAGIPTLAHSDLAAREKAALEIASKNADELLQRFRSEHPEVVFDLDDDQQLTMARYLLAHDAVGNQVTDDVAKHFSGHRKRARYLELADWISPAISLRSATDQCSGNSERAFVAFSSHAGGIHANYVGHFLIPSIANQECNQELINSLPEFQEVSLAMKVSTEGMIHSLISMSTWLILSTCLGMCWFRVKRLGN